MTPDNEQVIQAVMDFLGIKTWDECRRAVETHQEELLSEAADQVFLVLLEHFRQDAEATRALEQRRELLDRCRREGIEAAFAEFPPEPSHVSSSSNGLHDLLNELQGLSRPDDMPRRVQVCLRALGLVDRRSQPELWAALQVDLADSHFWNPMGNRRNNLERAIRHYQQALEFFTYELFPKDWAKTHFDLANAFLERIEGISYVNLDQAIYHYKKALEIYNKEAFPVEWAFVQTNIGEAYRRGLGRKQAANHEQAIHHFQKALEVLTEAAFPTDWARIQNNLGGTFITRILGERAANLELAIQHLKQALKIRTKESFPVNWAATQHNLGMSFSQRIQGEGSFNIEQAIQHLKQALEIWTQKNFPTEWAKTQDGLGIAYFKRVMGERAVNIERAIEHFDLALRVRNRETLPEEWADTQMNLGAAFGDRILGDRVDNRERSIYHFLNALEVYNRETYPENWANTLRNLGKAYFDRVLGIQGDNLEKAILYYHQALELLSKESLPEEWATAQNELGAAYFKSILGDRAANLERAISHFRLALDIRTKEAFPEEWAVIQNNLGAAYVKRILGEPAANLERAIAHLQSALEIRTKEAFPEEWAFVKINLGEAFRIRFRGERAANLEQAIYHLQRAIEVCTREVFPEEWARAQETLGIIYIDRIFGDRETNREKAIEHLLNSLEVDTKQAYPEKWAQIQSNLGAAYLYRILGESSTNTEQAILHLQQSIEVFTKEAFPEDWAQTQINLGGAYLYRILGEQAANIEQAILHCQLALEVYTQETFQINWAKAQTNLSLAFRDRIEGERSTNLEQASQYSQQALKVFSQENFPADRRRVLIQFGHMHFMEKHWEEAHAAYAEAVQTGEMVLEAAYTEIGRIAEVGAISHLNARAAYCLLELGQPDQALVSLEGGKTRLLTETLAMGGVDLEEIPKEKKDTLLEARQTLRQLEAEMRLNPGTLGRRPDNELVSLLQPARARLQDLIQHIRADHPHFMPTGLDLTGILELIPVGGALVAPLATLHGGAVFVLPHGLSQITKDQVIYLEELTEAAIKAFLVGSESKPGWQRLYYSWKNNTKSYIAWKAWLAGIETLTCQLWDMIIGRVQKRLVKLGIAPGAPVILMPQGGLGLLPLHAAWRDVNGVKRAFLDDFTVTYAPSSFTLNVSRQRLQEEQRQGQSLLAVINPTKDLIYTPQEGEAAASLFPQESVLVLREEEATPAAFLQGAPGRSYIHYSGHGHYDWEDFLHSGLLLAGRVPFTLNDVITHLDLSSSRLVTLSACETGITDSRQSPDEYLGLPAGFLQAGAPGVVSTLWAVADQSTCLLMECFYRKHRVEGLPPAQALRAAQLWLRDATRRELGDYYQNYLRMGPAAAQEAYTEVVLGGPPDEKPYSHPFYWAAFTFTGA